MDRDLRRAYREFLADPGDLEAAESLRGALARTERSIAASLRDELIGQYFATVSWENFGLPEPERRHPRRVGPALLAPRAPAALGLRWRAAGSLLAATHGVVLLEVRGALRAHDLRTGETRWEVPSLLEEGHDLDESEGRRERIGWAVAPWGAVELAAEFDAPLTYRRRGRYHAELGRVTERSAGERLEGGGRLLLQVALPAPTWEELPDLFRESSEPGEGLCGGDLELPEWQDSLYELELDPTDPTFALRTVEQGRGEGHAFVVRTGRDAPRVDPVPWELFPDLPPDRDDASEDYQREVVTRGLRRWELDFRAGSLRSDSSGQGHSWSLQVPALGRGEIDLVAFQEQLWVLGLGPSGGVRFRPGSEPEPLDLAGVLEGRGFSSAQGARGYGLEERLVLQGGSEEVICLG